MRAKKERGPAAIDGKAILRVYTGRQGVRVRVPRELLDESGDDPARREQDQVLPAGDRGGRPESAGQDARDRRVLLHGRLRPRLAQWEFRQERHGVLRQRGVR